MNTGHSSLVCPNGCPTKLKQRKFNFSSSDGASGYEYNCDPNCNAVKFYVCRWIPEDNHAIIKIPVPVPLAETTCRVPKDDQNDFPICSFMAGALL